MTHLKLTSTQVVTWDRKKKEKKSKMRIAERNPNDNYLRSGAITEAVGSAVVSQHLLDLRLILSNRCIFWASPNSKQQMHLLGLK
jgi:hypothetical protein